MPVFRPSRSDVNLSNFWNALNRNAPAEELARLAQLVEPSELAAIHRARELHSWQLPDLNFAHRLERTIMNATLHPTAQVIPLPRIHVHPQPRPRDPLPQLKPWLGRRRVAVISFALTAVLLLATLAGIWFATERNGENNLLGPASATPTTEASPDAPMYRGNPARTGVFPGPAIDGAPIELWTLQTGEPVNLGAAVVDGVLYLPAGSQGFEARNAMTGDLLWAFPTDAPAVSAPAVVGGLGYVIDAEGTLYAVKTGDGSEAWRMANIFVNSSVAPVDGLVYAASAEGTLFALDAATGAITWQVATGADTRGGLAVADGIVYQGNAAGVMSAFDAKTGEPRWTFQNEEGAGGATVTVANGQIYFTIGGDANAAMYAVDAATGEQTWRQEQGPDQGFISTTATPTRLYSVALDGKLHALDAATGETVWTYQLQEFVRSIPVLVDDTLYVADNGGFVRAIDPATGQQRWEFPIAGEIDLGWPVVSNGVLYIGTSFGNFYAITGSDMIPAQSIPTPTPAATPVPTDAAASPVASPQVSDQVTLLWETTGGEGGLESAGTVALAPDGTIWVADTGQHRFLIFDADGNLLESWTGTGDGEFRFMRANGDRFNAIAFAPDGSFYVLDPGNFRIQAFAADRSFLGSIGGFGQEPGQFLRPIDVAIDPTGNLAVLDDRRWDIQTFAPDGALVATIPLQSTGTGAYEMNSFTIDAAGSFYVAELSEDSPKARIVEKFDPEGNLVQQYGQAPGPGKLVDHPGRIAVDPAGYVYVTENELNPRILVFTPEGEYLTEFGGPESPAFAFEGLSGLALDGQGNVYVADGFQNRLVKLRLPEFLIPAAPDQVTLLWETTGGPTPLQKTSSVRIAPDGNVWVADGGHSQFQIFSPDGTFIEAWGTPGSGDGQFDFVRPDSDGDSFGAVAFAPDGSFYVADMGNRRIQHFTADRTFLHAWGSFGAEDGQFISPIDIAVDAQGNVFVDDDKREDIQKFAADGTFLLSFGGSGHGPGQLEFQGWMTIDGDGNVWVADSANGRIQEWANDGTFVREVGLAGTVGDPSNLAFDEQGRLYVLDNKDKRVVVLDASYAVIASWDLTTTDGAPPETVIGMALDSDGGLYVSDYLGSVLLKYQLGAIPDGTPDAP
jgi:outer membrane protein assembly factor BamB